MCGLTMSYLGSPYSNSHFPDYDFDEEQFDDEDDRENDYPQDENDEDTEDASETDTGRHEEPLEIKEQMYQDKHAVLKRTLQELKDGHHPEYNFKVKKLEYQYKDRIRNNMLYKDYRTECVEQEYFLEKKAGAKEFEDKKIDLRENLISDLEDKKRTIEAERYSMELTGDSMEVKPVMTRKLRRRPNDPIPVPEKRRKAPTAQLTYLLEEKEIENDLKIINKGKVAPSTIRKSSENNVASITPVPNPAHLSPNLNNDVPLIEAKVEDGKLLYEKRWFHRGQSVFVEGRDLQKCAGHILAINNDIIYVKRPDGTKVKIYLQQLLNGKYAIKRRAS